LSQEMIAAGYKPRTATPSDAHEMCLGHYFQDQPAA
jgi:hypothetical protein